MSLASRPKVFTIAIGNDGEIVLDPVEETTVGLKYEVRDLFYSAIGFKIVADTMPPPCFDLDELRHRNALVGAKIGDG